MVDIYLMDFPFLYTLKALCQLTAWSQPLIALSFSSACLFPQRAFSARLRVRGDEKNNSLSGGRPNVMTLGQDVYHTTVELSGKLASEPPRQSVFWTVRSK